MRMEDEGQEVIEARKRKLAAALAEKNRKMSAKSNKFELSNKYRPFLSESPKKKKYTIPRSPTN